MIEKKEEKKEKGFDDKNRINTAYSQMNFSSGGISWQFLRFALINSVGKGSLYAFLHASFWHKSQKNK